MIPFTDDRLSSEAFIRLPELERQVGLKRAAIYASIKAGKFPAQHKLTKRASGWLVGEVRAWKADPLNWRAPILDRPTLQGNDTTQPTA